MCVTKYALRALYGFIQGLFLWLVILASYQHTPVLQMLSTAARIVHSHQCPDYMSNTVSLVSDDPGRRRLR